MRENYLPRKRGRLMLIDQQLTRAGQHVGDPINSSSLFNHQGVACRETQLAQA